MCLAPTFVSGTLTSASIHFLSAVVSFFNSHYPFHVRDVSLNCESNIRNRRIFLSLRLSIIHFFPLYFNSLSQSTCFLLIKRRETWQLILDVTGCIYHTASEFVSVSFIIFLFPHHVLIVIDSLSLSKVLVVVVITLVLVSIQVETVSWFVEMTRYEKAKRECRLFVDSCCWVGKEKK